MEQFYQDNQPLFQQTKKGRSIVNLLRNFWFVLGIIATILIIAGAACLIWLFYFDTGTGEEYTDTTETTVETPSSDCNVVVITLHGELTTYNAPVESSNGDINNDISTSDDIRDTIDSVEASPAIKAMILEIDSYGGDAVAGEEIANSLKRSTKPTIALIRRQGLSAAYLAATGTDTIFASKNSDVGCIGVTMSYLDNTQKNIKDGLTYNQLSTGKFKDSGDPDKPLTIEERKLFERDLNIMHNNFITAVAENRKMSIAKVKQLADGSSMLGDQALQNGLIDKIGDIYDVQDYLKQQLNEDIELCWE